MTQDSTKVKNRSTSDIEVDAAMEAATNDVVSHCLRTAGEAFTFDNVSHWLDKAKISTHTKGRTTVNDIVYTKLVNELGEDHSFVKSFKNAFVPTR